MLNNVWLRFVNFGVANRFHYTDWEEIEINKDLTATPPLYQNILKHELGHSPGANTWHDFKWDLKDGIRKKGLYKWMLKHPKSFTQLLPAYYDRYKRTWVVDLNGWILWVLIIFMIGGISWVIGGF